ncbi:MAG: hypothetical protein J7604_06120 [Sporocytophaga sp.]|uniref:hypothetical protein n=1 Tax=Sporocytophaga sp. TaxID=2231183 RepID=UPI001B26DE28|nr:hypothetical protein [Sporocytophaga sp.]MBO9699768.1 hypothetical protein [Sporocytophaga sp.]
MKESVIENTIEIKAPSIEVEIKSEVAKKEKNRLWLYLVLIPLIFLGDRGIGAFLEYLTMTSNLRYSKLYNGKGEADIVILGNSRGNGYYEPEIRKITGMTTLNLSYNALPGEIGQALIEDYFERYKAKLVIVDVSLVMKTEDQVITSFRPYMSKSEKISALIQDVSPATARGCKISRLYQYNSELFHRALYYLGKQEGDWILNKQIKEELLTHDNLADSLDVVIKQGGLDNLKAIAEVAKKHNTKVEFVIAPYHSIWLNKIHNIKDFLAAIKNNTGVEVRDYCRFTNDKTCYSDYLHLNKKGSLLYMKKLQDDGVFALK